MEKAFPFVVPFKHPSSQSAFFGGDGEDFLVVVCDAQLLGKDVSDLSAAATELASDADSVRRVHMVVVDMW